MHKTHSLQLKNLEVFAIGAAINMLGKKSEKVRE
jgi:hypothetical protein